MNLESYQGFLSAMARVQSLVKIKIQLIMLYFNYNWELHQHSSKDD